MRLGRRKKAGSVTPVRIFQELMEPLSTQCENRICRVRGSLQHLTSSAILTLSKDATRQLAMAVLLGTKSAETINHDPVMKDHFPGGDLSHLPLAETSANPVLEERDLHCGIRLL